MDSQECPKELLAVKDVLLLRCQPGDIILIQVDVEGLPKERADKYIKRVCDHFSTIIPDREVKAVAMAHTTKVSIIRREDGDSDSTTGK